MSSMSTNHISFGKERPQEKNKPIKKPKGWHFQTPEPEKVEEEEDLGTPIIEEILNPHTSSVNKELS